MSPVISAGIGKFIMERMEGAISPNLPLLTVPFQFLSIIKRGTRLSEWAVLGVPSSFKAKSALP